MIVLFNPWSTPSPKKPLPMSLLAVGSLVSATVTVLFLGVAVAPYMIAVFSLAERVVPSARVGAAMTMLASATGVGYALGSSLAGRLADTSGGTAAFGVTIGATVLAVLLMSSQQGRLRAAVEEPVEREALTPLGA